MTDVLKTEAAKPRLAAAERRQAVLEAACRVFGRTGYRGATTAEIAREAGITEPILYRHFGSKRDLYLACLDDAWRRLREVAEEALAHDPKGCLGAVSTAYTQSGAHVRLVDLWLQAIGVAADDPAIAGAIREQVQEVHRFFADAIRHGQEVGAVLPERDPVAEAWIFVAGGLLSTLDDRLGGLLGDDLDRLRTERRRWMTGNA